MACAISSPTEDNVRDTPLILLTDSYRMGCAFCSRSNPSIESY